MNKEITSVVSVIVFDKHQNTIISNTVVINDTQLAEQVFINECRDHFTKDFNEYIQEEINVALENGYKENDSKIVFINWPETKVTQLEKCVVDSTETTVHDGHDINEKPCKYEVVTKNGELISINGHKMFKSPVDWDGSSSHDRCYICCKPIKNITNDVTWWTDESHLCKHNEPFYFTNGGECMDIVICKDCQKKHGLVD